ncbi:hypothetical protein JOB18_014200 [Solea senegalensis]|uniref:Uncharacterized protein n=1 Tax=Solea senegalensis TaxID=28829 RepID=A0AAV6QWY0_SOLSE|nr:hypothetical protein JOB18_014200 [Solea senegalensis]
MVTGVKSAVSLLLLMMMMMTLLHLSSGHRLGDVSASSSLSTLLSVNPQCVVSLLLLAFAVVLSTAVYAWVLRHISEGCCQPITGTGAVEPEAQRIGRQSVTGETSLTDSGTGADGRTDGGEKEREKRGIKRTNKRRLCGASSRRTAPTKPKHRERKLRSGGNCHPPLNLVAPSAGRLSSLAPPLLARSPAACLRWVSVPPLANTPVAPRDTSPPRKKLHLSRLSVTRHPRVTSKQCPSPFLVTFYIRRRV